MADEGPDQDMMEKITSLAKRRGFVFQSSEIYGGLRSCYDYGPLGVELKRNVKDQWWRTMVHEQEKIAGIDASILMHPRVWEASGHVEGFNDPLVDCLACKARFRADQAPTEDPGATVEWDHPEEGRVEGTVGELGILCPECGSPELSDVRQFNLMFETNLGPVEDESSTVYLRPETAQAMFVNFANVQNTYRFKVPFGIAQVGKSFRNEVTLEHFTFRSAEFEQMEMEWFCQPPEHSPEGKDPSHWYEYWRDERLRWYSDLGIREENLRLREHTDDELAHYAKECADVEYRYPWGWGELEGIANRTDYDLKRHQEVSGKRLTYFDHRVEEHYHPYVVEPAAGADRAALAFLLDAYDEEPPPEGRKEGRTVLRFDPRIAPIKAAVFPLVRKDGMPEKARELVQAFWDVSVNAFYDEKHSIGRRYRRQDEAGTPFCLTVDGDTVEDDTVTIRYRDSMEQERVPMEDAVEVVRAKIRAGGRDVTGPE